MCLVENKSIKGVLLDSYYKENNLFVTIKNKSGFKEDYIVDFYPYFYISFYGSDTEILKSVDFIKNNISVKSITEEIKENKSKVYKIKFNTIDDLVEIKNKLQNQDFPEIDNYSLHEYDVPFIYRFFLDYSLCNFRNVELILNSENLVIDLKSNDVVEISKFNSGCFNIKTLMSEDSNLANAKKDPIISISYVSNNIKNIFLLINRDLNNNKLKEDLLNKFQDKNLVLELFDNEIDLISSFKDFIISKDPDIIYTYNGYSDFKYLAKRYLFLTDEELDFNPRKLIFDKSKNKKFYLEGIIHFDVYKLIKLLNYFQVFNYSKFDLNSVYFNITGESKIKLDNLQIRSKYLANNYKDIIDCVLDECLAVDYLAKNYVGFVYEMAYFLDSPIIDVLYSSASKMVEKLFMKDYVKNNLLIPNKPNKNEINERYKHTFTGAFVYQPSSGLYENLAVLDFRSYHISLLISYNISPETLNTDSNNFKIVLGEKITFDKVGFIPKLLKTLLNIRLKFKKEMKSKEPLSAEYSSLYSRQYAIKILLASTYGYLGFAGSRWYCSKCLELMYLLVRNKIKELISTFESYGYQVVYGDTDSCFVKFTNLKELENDINKINSNLPKEMYLELENLFKSAIFVKSRGSDKAAKKKYAMLDYNGNLKIKGFEYVRRDWCELVKTTQKKVLEIVLNSQDSKKAVSYIKEIILKLQNRIINNKDLIIQSIVHKNINNYKTMNPAVFAIENAKEKNISFKSGDLVEYIITNTNSKSISSKARYFKLVSEKDYDIDYYINNQLIPSVYPILEVFGITKDELLNGKKQKGIGDFF